MPPTARNQMLGKPFAKALSARPMAEPLPIHHRIVAAGRQGKASAFVGAPIFYHRVHNQR